MSDMLEFLVMIRKKILRDKRIPYLLNWKNPLHYIVIKDLGSGLKTNKPGLRKLLKSFF